MRIEDYGLIGDAQTGTLIVASEVELAHWAMGRQAGLSSKPPFAAIRAAKICRAFLPPASNCRKSWKELLQNRLLGLRIFSSHEELFHEDSRMAA